MLTANAVRSINPATGETLGEVSISSPDDIQAAIAAARQAAPAWRALGAAGRAAVLQRLCDDFAGHREELATLISKEMGRPIDGSLKSIDAPLATMKWNLDHAAENLAPETTFEDSKQLHQIYYEPYGVFGVIAPWNYPLSNFVMTALQPLIAGNTVVYKASEEVPLFGKALNEAFARAKIPEGVFGQIFGGGEVGEALVRAVDHVHFTGSTVVGQKLYKIAAERFIPITLELGGSDAGIVFEDADLDRMIEPIFWAKFVNSGQRCCSLKRLYVHQSRYQELVAKLSDYMRKQKIGDPLDASTKLGPMVSEKQKKLIAAQVDDAKAKGAKILAGEDIKVPSTGAYYPPLLMANVKPDMRASCEELFGPVLPIISFEDEAEAVKLANASEYGLSAFVYTQDHARYAQVAAQLQAGSIAHNGVDYFQAWNPFGGYKHSGLGRSGGKAGLQSCCQIKVITTEK